jgi:hypothetical protein
LRVEDVWSGVLGFGVKKRVRAKGVNFSFALLILSVSLGKMEAWYDS